MGATESSASSSDNLFSQLRDVPFKDLGKQFVKEFRDDDVLGLASEVAYHLIFAIPPLLILTITMAAALNQFTNVPVEETLRDFVNERAPASVEEVMDTIITNAVGEVSGGLVSISLLTTAAVAIWSGSNGIASIMKAYNRAYDVEEGRPYIKKRIVATGLTILMVVLINAAFALFVFGETIGAWLANWLGLGNQFRTVWEIVRWPAAVVLFMFLLAVLYYLAPAIEQSFRWISPGSVTATILWVVALFGFRYYLNIASPGSTYGAFSSVIVFLFFLYITSIVLLIGAEVNAILQKRYDETVVRDRAEHPERLTSDDARREAAGDARGLEQRKGRRIDNGSDIHHPVEQRPTLRPLQRRRARKPASGSVIAGISLAAVGTALGWMLGWRAGRR